MEYISLYEYFKLLDEEIISLNNYLEKFTT